jgi:hypothetical protein
MADMSVLDYAMMVEDTHVDTLVVEYRRRGPDTAINGRGRGPLVAVSLTDRLADGLSMVYSFYDPELRRPRPRHLHDPRPHPPGPRRWACPTSISATGSRVPQDGLQGAASARRST